MITLKDTIAQSKMIEAGKRLALIFHDIPTILHIGTTTAAIDTWIEEQLIKADLKGVCKGYAGYKHVSCISLNDQVVHGVPSANVALQNGDMITVDVCASWQGYCADMARCYFIGQESVLGRQLVDAAQQALDKGIAQAVVGRKLSDISYAIQHEVERQGFSVIRDFAGHGIGKKMHEDPEILNYGKPNRGPVLKAGMAFAIEPMIAAGDYKVYITSDGWTVKTVDKSLAAHVEDTIIILDEGPLIITRFSQKELVV